MLLPRLALAMTFLLLPSYAQQAPATRATITRTPIASMAASQVRSIPTPDFTGKTLPEVNAMIAIPGTKSNLFASVLPQGELTGVVISQSPEPKTPVYPGRSRLVVTLAPRKPSLIDEIVQQIVDQPRRAVVPDVRNRTLAEATRLLRAARLNPDTRGDTSGVVEQQNPLPRTSVALNSNVELVFTPPQTVVPSLYGLSLEAAQSSLARAYLRMGSTSGDETTEIIAQSVQPGTQIPRGTAIEVDFRTPPPPPARQPTGETSNPQQPQQPQTPQTPPEEPRTPKPPPEVFVPSLVKLTREKAIDALTAVDLIARPTGNEKGSVIDQSPAAGASVVVGSTVAFTLRMPTVAVPSVIGDPPSNAEARLRVFGLVARAQNSSASKSGGTRVVIAQSPAAGTEVSVGTTVVMTVGNAALQPLEPAWWQRVHPWVFPAAAVLVGLLGFGAWKIARHPDSHSTQRSASATSGFTLNSRPAPSRIATGQPPALRFTVTLHNRRHTTERYSITSEPTVNRKG